MPPGVGNMNIEKYFRIWWKMTLLSFTVDVTNRFAAILFLAGKLLRFLFFLFFLILLVSRTKTLAGYDVNQVVFFFLTFNLVDIIVQLFLRGVYHFRSLLVTGNFDFILLQPIHPLFRSLASHTDVLDLMTLIPLVSYMIWFLASGKIVIALPGVIFYLILIICSFLIASAIHIMVLAVGVLTTEVDNVIWIYRDLSGMGRIPIDVYREWLRNFLIFVVPISVIMTFPAKALMGLLSWPWVIFSLFLAAVLLFLSLRFWNFALKKYSSASS